MARLRSLVVGGFALRCVEGVHVGKGLNDYNNVHARYCPPSTTAREFKAAPLRVDAVQDEPVFPHVGWLACRELGRECWGRGVEG